MADMLIRGIDDAKERIRVRAAENGRSMESEAREILERSVTGGAAQVWDRHWDSPADSRRGTAVLHAPLTSMMVESLIEHDFGGVVLSFDHRASRYYGETRAGRKAEGRRTGNADAQCSALLQWQKSIRMPTTCEGLLRFRIARPHSERRQPG